MTDLIQINGVEINVVSENDTFMVSNKQVAEGFGATLKSIQNMKLRNKKELKEGVHFVDVSNGNKSPITMWTKKGIITLGFKLRATRKTIAFRDWASDYIIKQNNALMSPNQITEALALTAQSLTLQDERIDMHHERIQEVELQTNSQDDRLIQLENNVRLTNQQEYELTQTHHRKVYELLKFYGKDAEDKTLKRQTHAKVWSIFKKRFMLPRYNELQANKFNDGIAFLNDISLKDMA